MSLSLEQFKNKTMGGSYGNPGTGTYKGQCVSYVRMYMEEVQGVKTRIAGNAVDYWYNSWVLSLYDRVPKGQERNGDILVWGNDNGNWTGSAGHIAIRYNPGVMLNQNYGNSLKVSINGFFAPGYLGALRLKAPATPEVKVNAIYMDVLERPVDAGSLAMRMTQSESKIRSELKQSDEYKRLQASKALAIKKAQKAQAIEAERARVAAVEAQRLADMAAALAKTEEVAKAKRLAEAKALEAQKLADEAATQAKVEADASKDLATQTWFLKLLTAIFTAITNFVKGVK